jgi:ankyrin repeat protein
MSSPDSASVRRAVMRHSLPEVTQALSQGGAVDALDEGGRTSLFYAAKDGDSAIIDELIRHGANPNAQDKSLAACRTGVDFHVPAIVLQIAIKCAENYCCDCG